MHLILDSIRELKPLDSNNFKFVEAEINFETAINLIIEKGAIPAKYALLLEVTKKYETKYYQIFQVAIVRLYLYAKYKYKGDSDDVKRWMRNGKLPRGEYFSAISMGVVFKKIERVVKIYQQLGKLEDEIQEIGENKKITNKQQQSLRKKEDKIEEYEGELSNILDLITKYLDRIVTLVASSGAAQ